MTRLKRKEKLKNKAKFLTTGQRKADEEDCSDKVVGHLGVLPGDDDVKLSPLLNQSSLLNQFSLNLWWFFEGVLIFSMPNFDD